MSNKITELAYLRNQLASANFGMAEKQLLVKIKRDILELDAPFKELALNAINNSEEDIKKAKFELATQEVQLIHNFPFEEPHTWNSDYFYKIELLSYLEQVDDVQRIKKLIFLLGRLQGKLNMQYPR